MRLERSACQFDAIFSAERRYVTSTLRRFGVSERDLEDVTHDVFLRVHRQLATYAPSRPLRPWLFAFVVRAASDYRKLHRHRVEVLDDGAGAAEEIASAPLAEEAVATKERERMVAAALASMDDARRGIFILHELEEWPMSRVAAHFDMPINTGYSRLRVAREEFAVAVRRVAQRH